MENISGSNSEQPSHVDPNPTNLTQPTVPENVAPPASPDDSPGTSEDRPTNQTCAIKRTQSLPDSHRKYFNIRTVTTTLRDEHEHDLTRIASKLSLKFRSNVMNFAKRSNVASVKSSNPQNWRRSRTSNTPNNTAITVLYSDEASYTSSESLIAKDAMGYSQSNNQPLLLPKSTSAITRSASQPPPYHVATAYDTTTIQLTPSVPPPLVLYSAPPLQGAPPTYSALMQIGPQESTSRRFNIFSRREVRIQPSAPFIAPPPPPTYAQSQGFCVAHASQVIDLHDAVWGNEPVTVICPYCNNFVITSVHYRQSNLTHFSALALCICGCWPCCLLPYCMKTCKCAHHECPICSNVIGIHSPWEAT